MQLVEHELLLFAAFWFVVGAADEFAVDLVWLWLKLTGRIETEPPVADRNTEPLSGRAAAFVPAWQEADVIGPMIRHTLSAWRQDAFTLYVGLYVNDWATLEAAVAAAGDDPRVRLVINDRAGPTTKADCLNRIYAALCDDEARSGERFASIVLHDSEDMVHPAALALIDEMLGPIDFVQLPVRPEPQAASPMVAGHYSDEFAESHAKGMVVRDAIGAAIPAAGVGCGFAREAIADLARRRFQQGRDGPFEDDCLTEDYELGLTVSRGRRARFVRRHDVYGELIATRAYFPPSLEASVRQKTRWIHGISLQGWDRLGWSLNPIDIWMTLRDRNGPLTALVLAVAYVLLAIEAVLGVARLAGWQDAVALPPLLRAMIAISFASLAWRALWRFFFTAREYGIGEGLRAIVRIPVSNVITIIAARRALFAYVGTLFGRRLHWDKTLHAAHPANATPRSADITPATATATATARALP
ncbi:hypothetical protein B2G71_06520 [Novosphingobium sp. PC22D]|nr:hypothetical protein B2G71_06520 [Novosphingobium sp. PC22D]